MRRAAASAVVSAIVLALSACTSSPRTVTPMAMATPTDLAAVVTPTTTPDDATLTLYVCTAATVAAADGTMLFNDQWARLEKAAAKGDPAAMVKAAELIQRKFVALAAGLRTLSRKSVAPQVKAVLVEGSASLTEIASQTYAGTTADIKKELADLAAGFAKACP